MGIRGPKSESGQNLTKKANPQVVSPKRRLAEIVNLVVETASVKGWGAEIEAQDDKSYRYATIAVSRNTAGSIIEGTFEIICDKSIKISYHKNSFYDWGLSALLEATQNELQNLPWIEKKPPVSPRENDNLELIERLLRRFHRLARQLKHRHADRQGFHVHDEYDAQDLLHAILRGLFDDVRAEEYTPSYAGGSSRIDFLLKFEKVAVELKMASASLRDKQVGEQLLIDIGRYKTHPDCEKLVCFVYDPGGNLKNPDGLEADLSQSVGKLTVKVIVVSV